MPPKRAPKPTVEAFLDAYPEEIATLAHRLRALVREELPTAEERVNPGWRGLAYHHPEAGYVCGIFPFETEVRLLFEWGARLPDADGVLEGATRQVRHVALRPGGAWPEDAMRRLLLLASHGRPSA